MPLTKIKSLGITDGTIVGDDINSTFNLTGKTVTLPAGTGGKVLQVVSTTKTDRFSASSTSSFTDITGMSVSITPSASANKILIICTIAGGGTSSRYAFRLMRDSTAIAIGDSEGTRQRATVGYHSGLSGADVTSASFNFLDSPSATSSTTYKVQYIADANIAINSTVDNEDGTGANKTRTVSTITVMEIAG